MRCRAPHVGLAFGLAFSACGLDAHAQWTNSSRTAIAWGVNRLPSSAPGTSNGTRSFNGGQPSLIIDSADGQSLVAVYSSGASHEGTTAISAARRSFDGGRSWGDEAFDTITIDVNPLPTDHRSLISSACKLDTGPYAGRIIAVGARGYVVGVENYDSYSFWTDDRVTWHAVKMPQISSYYTIGISCDQRADGSVLATMYTRKSGVSGARGYTTYSTDGGASWLLFDSSIVEGQANENAVPPFPGVIAGDASMTMEKKEDFAQVLRDHSTCVKTNNVLALIRSDDSAQKIYQNSSSDGGRTWGTPAIAFDGYNFPAFAVSDKTGNCGELAYAGRHATGLPPDGNDYSVFRTSSNDGSGWSAEVPLYESSYGTGSSLGCGPRWRDSNTLEILATWSPPGKIFNWCRLEDTQWKRSPSSAGEFARYGVDANKRHPSKYLSNVWAWWTIESFRWRPTTASTQITSWPNLMGLPQRDLVPTSFGGFLFQDGSQIVGPPDGLVGGVGIAATSVGNEGLQLNIAESIAQPLEITFVVDVPQAGGLSGGQPFANDGSGASIVYITTNSGEFQTAIGGQAVQWTHTSAMPGGPVVATAIFNGASSKMIVNGIDLAKAGGGTLTSAAWTNLRWGGVGCCSAPKGYREMTVSQGNSAATVIAYHDVLCMQHLGRHCP